MVREETIIREEIHEGQVVQLKEVRHTTEVTKEVAAIKSKTDVPVLGGFSMATTLSGGGIATLVLGYIGTKLRNMQPPTPKPAPVVQQVKGTREED